MDLAILESRALDGIDGNMAALILANACGRPQAHFGTYVAPTFDYDEFCEALHVLAGRHAGLEVAEEGRSGKGRPIYSISLGPKEAPVVYVDCGIHPDEWAPCYGVPMYLARLADELERGMPWARAMLEGLRVRCIPILGADGWEERNRSPRGVNLNRNFPPGWKECPDADKGAGPLSEPEARIVDGIFRRGNVIVAVNWHETSANTNWIGYPYARGRYAKYSAAAPGIFGQVIDGRHFWRQPSVWTQVYDQRNYEYHYTDSFPYLRDYAPSKSPFEINHAETFGIDGLIVEQYGNSDFAVAASTQRTDMAAFIMEMILGLQVGLVVRNPHTEEMDASFPVALRRASGAAVYAEDGGEWGGCAVVERNGVMCAEGRIPPGGCMMVLGDPAPWKKRD